VVHPVYLDDITYLEAKIGYRVLIYRLMEICFEILGQLVGIANHKKPGVTCVTPGNLNTESIEINSWDGT